MSNVPTVTYQFQQDPDTLGNTPGEQLGEILKQSDFIEEALVDETQSAQQIEDLVAQLHHDIESFWRALARRNGQEYVDLVFQRYEDKQKERSAA